ncbi:plant cysteine oxidase 1-like [Phragmites australis]|uniref:plant cysteine oxidase 1-like n=1 Tax=Phragmites australis TaxID=29695 RepID=UPI002D77DA82|nr:plant cysteine oxidase 1-like [Phragmites australis]
MVVSKKVALHVDGLTLQDVGLDATMPYLRANPQGRPKVTYLHFADSPRLSFGVFCLPQSAVIPLHDHPGMTVFSKILFGSMHIRSYDWVKAPAGNQATRMSNGARLAKLNTDAVLDASSETVVLYPEDGGNLHCFTATTPCALLDVMGPPYCQAEGRDCSYYGARAVPAGGDGQYAWLKQVPSTFEMDTFHMGPSIRK